MPKSFIPQDQRDFARSTSGILLSNPFLPERIAHERDALGQDYVELDKPWNVLNVETAGDPNIFALIERVVQTCNAARSALDSVPRDQICPDEAADYFNMVLIALYYVHFREAFTDIIEKAQARGVCGDVGFYDEYQERFHHFVEPVQHVLHPAFSDVHMFAYGFQIRRAYYYTFRYVIGTSPAVVGLRARIWQSIFSHDLERYRRTLYDRMNNIFTLITGPSGSGKELVASAIGMSRYIPYNPKRCRFADDFLKGYYPLNLSAISPTLIESELFGHRKGAFTGALSDREGYFAASGPWGTVFLDEVGDVDPDIQVKLLRVLQSRTFQTLGDTESKTFEGKVIAATNKNLIEEIRAGRFRSDLFYRLCADQVETPSLHQILEDQPAELAFLVRYIADGVVGTDEAQAFTEEVCTWIKDRMDPHYAWPGNFRELEQCVKNILIQQHYTPHTLQKHSFLDQVRAGKLTTEELLSGYITRIYESTQNFEQTARMLEIDSRTVKKYLKLHSS